MWNGPYLSLSSIHIILHIVCFSVYARDGAFPARYDVASVVVYVQDANDHNPTFVSDYYVLSVPENEVSSSFHVVVAEDKDIGVNSQMSYSIMGMLNYYS